MQITWYGHSAFRLDFAGKAVLIDPFFTGNPAFVSDKAAAIKGVTHIVLTHGHGDHVGDTLDIAKSTGVPVITNYDLCMWLAAQGLEIVGRANTGAEALELAARLTPDVALVDIELDEEDGIELSHELASHAPVHVAMGNNDRPTVAELGALDEVSLDLEGIRLAMVHDAGPRDGRDRRMRRRFPEADLVVFGHSHIPLDVRDGAVHLFNPGSPTWKRRQPRPTFGWIEIEGADIRSRIVEL